MLEVMRARVPMGEVMEVCDPTHHSRMHHLRVIDYAS